MSNWIMRLFRRVKSTPSNRALLGLELFEDRALPSASVALSAVTHTLTVNGTTGDNEVKIASSGNNLKVTLDGHVHSYAKHAVSHIVVEEGVDNDQVVDSTTVPLTTIDCESSLAASLTGSTGAEGQITVLSGKSSVQLVVSGLSDDSTYTVEIAGTSVGTFTTDDTGAANTTLTDITASIASGTAVLIVDSDGNTDLSGTFATPTSTTSPTGPGGGSTGMASPPLVASLTGSSSSVTATITILPAQTSGDDNLLIVASGLSDDATYTVDIGGTAVGTFTTDDTGAANISLNDVTATAASGTAATIVDSNGNTDLSGTFATPTTTTPPSGPGPGGPGGSCNGMGSPPLVASLTGSSSSVTGTITILPSQTSGEDNILVVVSGLSDDTIYTVEIAGTAVGTFTTDGTGAANVTLNNVTSTVASGTAAIVVDSNGNTDLSGTFATSTTTAPPPGPPPGGPGGGPLGPGGPGGISSALFAR